MGPREENGDSNRRSKWKKKKSLKYVVTLLAASTYSADISLIAESHVSEDVFRIFRRNSDLMTV